MVARIDGSTPPLFLPSLALDPGTPGRIKVFCWDLCEE